MNRNNRKLAVIGGGASGLFAAVCAAEYALPHGGAEITVFEAQNRVGKKLLATGNGRCNLSNVNFDLSFYLGDKSLLSGVFDRFSASDTLAFFHSHGVLTRSDAAGRIYPRSNQATTVLDLLRELCGLYGVEIRTQTPVFSVRKTKDAFAVNGDGVFDAVIFSCGSPAGEAVTGCPEALKEMRLRTHPFLPALCPLILRGFTKSLKGVRAEGCVSLYADGVCVASDHGEIQYTDVGISGIPTMQISLFAARGFAAGKRMSVLVDSIPESDEESVRSFLFAQRSAFPRKKIGLTMGGIVHKKLGEFFLREENVDPETEIASLSPQQLRRIAAALKRKEYTVSGTAGLRGAQVAVGGVAAEELDPKTLECVRVPGCYVCGEAADVAGLCGGYNLQWAWSSGYVAAVSAMKKLLR